LYDFAKINLVSFDNNKLTFLVTFPVISRSYVYSRYTVIGNHHPSVTSFLLPIDLKIEDASIENFVSAKNCLEHDKIFACPAALNDHIDACMINNNCTNIISNDGSFSFHYSDNKQGVLVELQGNSEIYDIFKSKTLFKAQIGEKLCVYLDRRKGLLLRDNQRQISLFPSARNYNVNSKHDLPQLHVVNLPNFTMPARVMENEYVKILL